MGYLLYYYKDQIKISNTVLVIALEGIIALTGLAVQLLSMAKGTAHIANIADLHINLVIHRVPYPHSFHSLRGQHSQFMRVV